ncbi:hypothetical protein KBD45_04900 [Candidatus Dojkabacteria bacterium]|nr:hypothetical protein [Candidatus Dojkabacteria bacterium]
MKFRTKDTDVINFIKASGITGGTEFNAVNYLVVALKNAGLWTNIKALYPFVGGNAEAHKYNLVNPIDTNAAFRLQFNGSVTHDSSGVTFSSANGWANTFLVATTHLIANKTTLALYSRSPFSAATGGIDMGAAITTTRREELTIRSNLNGCGANINSTTNGAGSAGFINTDGTGFYFASRQTSTDLRMYKNGVLQSSATTTNNGTQSNIQMYLGARNVTNVAQGFTGRNFALALIGLDYTPAQTVDFYNIVQQYQTILNRQV